MDISELFYSVQGEGKRTGVPSFFIRTNFCNLRCLFAGGNMCDTPYTSWDPEDALNIGKMHVAEIISEYEKINCRDVVITGGEPAMQKEELVELCAALRKSNEKIYITLETNGTIFGEFANRVDLLSISPKLKTSVPFGTKYEKIHLRNMRNHEALQKFSALKSEGKASIQWKFVFTGEDDLKEIKEFQKQYKVDSEDIYLMPEGITREQLDAKRLQTIEACLSNGYNFTDRLHIIAWGNKRGV
jgi:7-carboxy-7-deazaguanine synthase